MNANRQVRPTKQQLAAAYGKRLPAVIACDLGVVFCGINPSLYSAAVGHHFARPGNRFWPALHAGGFTPRLYSPCEDRSLLELGYGLTNLVDHATARADELSFEQLEKGARQLELRIRRYQPRFVALLGISAFRVAFNWKTAEMGAQPFDVAGAKVWILPSPSGLNAHYQPQALAELFGELHEAVNAAT
jgi:TDG/mug DNA glycosylase family protein